MLALRSLGGLTDSPTAHLCLLTPLTDTPTIH